MHFAGIQKVIVYLHIGLVMEVDQVILRTLTKESIVYLVKNRQPEITKYL